MTSFRKACLDLKRACIKLAVLNENVMGVENFSSMHSGEVY